MEEITLIEINGKYYETYNFEEIDRNTYYGFIYVTVNKVNGKKYVGQHISWNENYLGSGHYFRNAIRKYGRENFKRVIIDLAKTQEELDEKETYYINEEFNAAKSKDWYNIKDGAQHGGNTLVGLSKGDYKRWVEKHSGKNNYMYGKHNYWGRHSEESKRKLSESHKGDKNPAKRPDVRKKLSLIKQKSGSAKGKNNGMYGKGHLLAGEKNGMYGKGYLLEGDKNGRAKEIVVYKDGKFYGEFTCVNPLVELVGSRPAAYKLVNGWKPSKRSKFYGWSACYKNVTESIKI